jgi:NitT/TauT family transport system ATP-binding protein
MMTNEVATMIDAKSPLVVQSGNSKHVLAVDCLAKTYNPGGPSAKEAIRDISFTADEEELVCIVGPSGAGKTTLLRCLSGLLLPSSGTVAFEGEPVLGSTPAAAAVVFQDYSRSLFPWLTVASNIALPLKSKGVKASARQAAVERALHAVGLSDVGSRHPWQLSGGMQQRVAIARALAYEPKLLLMDEPFASVDAQTRFELEDLILRVRSEFKMTIVFVTHDIDEAVYVGNRIFVLSKSPCIVKKELVVELPVVRDQVTTRSDPEFLTLRADVLRLVTEESSAERTTE